MVLFLRNASIFEEVAKDPLEVDYYYRMIKLVGSSSKVMPVGSLEINFCLRIQLHLDILLLKL